MIREHFKRLASMAVLGASLATLSSCSSTDSTQPEGDISFIEENWEIEAPESAETVEYYSTDSDFQGGREDVYVISMAEWDRAGPRMSGKLNVNGTVVLSWFKLAVGLWSKGTSASL